jgi:hypothetical protein
MINTALDRIEDGFLQVATKLGVSKEMLKSHSSSLKFVVQHVAVTIGTSRASDHSGTLKKRYYTMQETLLNSIPISPIPSCSLQLQN